MGKNEQLLLSSVFLTFILTELVILGGLGIAVPITVAIYIVSVQRYAKNCGITLHKCRSLMIFISLISINFVLFSNQLLKVTNCILLIGLLILYTNEVCEIELVQPYSIGWLKNIFDLGVTRTLDHIPYLVKVIKQVSSSIKESKFKEGIKMLVGVVIAVPVLIIIIELLMSVDAAFEGVINRIINCLHLDIDKFLIRILVYVPVFFLLGGFLYSIGRKEDKKLVSETTKKRLDYTIMLTVVILVCVTYLIYCMSQLAYFVSAFQGILPDHFTFAEYARRGFFEVLPIVLFNLGMIGLLNLFTKHDEKPNRLKWIKGISLFIIGFTLFLVISALSKMGLYISEYGLTLKRVYVAWLLILISLQMIVVAIKLIYKKLKLLKVIFYTSIGAYIVLNYANIDYWVAQSNIKVLANSAECWIEEEKLLEVERLENPAYDSISVFDTLSSSSVGPLIAYLEVEEGNSEKQNTILKVKETLKDKEEQLQVAKWQEWNIADAIARHKLNIDHR